MAYSEFMEPLRYLHALGSQYRHGRSRVFGHDLAEIIGLTRASPASFKWLGWKFDDIAAGFATG
jgi:hypothetical protein